MSESLNKVQMFTNYDFSESVSPTVIEKSTIFHFSIRLIIFILISFLIVYLVHQILLHLYSKNNKSKIHKQMTDDLSEYIQNKNK